MSEESVPVEVKGGVLEARQPERTGFQMVGEQAPLFAALAAARAAFGPVLKTRNNPFFNRKYADLSDVLDACMPAFNAQGLYLCQVPTSPDPDGCWTVYTVLTHSSGAYWIAAMTIARAEWQKFGSAMTYARRYTDSAILGVASEPDDDGNEADDKPARQPRQTPPERKTAQVPDYRPRADPGPSSQASQVATPVPPKVAVSAPAVAPSPAVSAAVPEAAKPKSNPPGPIAQAVAEHLANGDTLVAETPVPMTDATTIAIRTRLKAMGFNAKTQSQAQAKVRAIVNKSSEEMTEADGQKVLGALMAEAVPA